MGREQEKTEKALRPHCKFDQVEERRKDRWQKCPSQLCVLLWFLQGHQRVPESKTHISQYGTYLGIPAESSHWLGLAPPMLCGLGVNVVVGCRAQELINLCHCCGRLVTSILMATPTDKGRGKISIRRGPVLMATPMEIKIRGFFYYY